MPSWYIVAHLNGSDLLSNLSAVLATAVILAIVRAVAGRMQPAPYSPEEAAEQTAASEDGAEADQGEPTAPLALNEDSAKAIADLAGRAYADESDQTKALDTKSAALLAFTGAALVFTATVATRPPEGIVEPYRTVFSWAIYAPLLLFGSALLFLFEALKKRAFEEIDLSQWVKAEEMAKDAAEVYASIAATYENAVEHNHNINAIKAQRQVWGLRLLVGAIVVLMMLLVWIPVRWLPR